MNRNPYKSRTTQEAKAAKGRAQKERWNGTIVRAPDAETGLTSWAARAQLIASRIPRFPAGSDERRALGAAALAVRMAGRRRDPADIVLRFGHIDEATKQLAAAALAGTWPEDDEAPADA